MNRLPISIYDSGQVSGAVLEVGKGISSGVDYSILDEFNVHVDGSGRPLGIVGKNLESRLRITIDE